jgi:hypothetical protein
VHDQRLRPWGRSGSVIVPFDPPLPLHVDVGDIHHLKEGRPALPRRRGLPAPERVAFIGPSPEGASSPPKAVQHVPSDVANRPIVRDLEFFQPNAPALVQPHTRPMKVDLPPGRRIRTETLYRLQ